MLPARAPDGTCIYAIGDVHGRSDLLEAMFGLIDAHRARSGAEKTIEVLLGDLIDRGPDSRGVIDLAMARRASHGLIALRGNHDQYMLDALSDAGSIARWLDWGGIEALGSYGIEASRRDCEAPQALATALRAALPPAHAAFLAGMPLTHRCGDLLFVHAGIRPGIPLAQQAPRDLMTIRELFHGDERDHGFVVVHGHTPGAVPVVRPNRIGLDTKAYESGVLTCAAFTSGGFDFITATGPAASWTAPH